MPKKNSRECLSEQQIADAFRRWCDGEDVCDIADELYVCTRTLFRMFKRRGMRKSNMKKCH